MNTTTLNAGRSLWLPDPVIKYVSDTEVELKPAPAWAGREQTATLDPLTHPGWDSLVAAHPQGSFFH